MRSPLCTSFVVVTFLILAPTSSFAQRGQTSAITGVVHDGTNAPVPGVTVTASSAQLIGGPAVTTTNDEGVYRLLELLPGEYVLRVELAGFKTVLRSGIVLAPGGSVALDWTLEISPAEELVEVRAPSPMVDVRTAAVPSRLTSEQLRGLPTERTIPGLVNLTPGTVADVPLGASAASIAVSFDGSPGSHVANGVPIIFPIFDAIDELQVIASGAGAEYGDFTGVQANLITRSGSNVVRGFGEYRTRRPGWVGNNRHDLPEQLRETFRPTQVLNDWDGAASLGCPLVHDRLWYFASYQHIVEDSRPPAWSSLPRLPDEPTSSRRDSRAIAKLTASPWRNFRLEGFYQHNNQRGDALDAGPYTMPEAVLSLRDSQHVWNARLLWTPTNDTFVTLTHGGTAWDYCECSTAPATKEGPAPRYDFVTGISSGNYVWYYENSAVPLTTTANVTRLIDGVPGGSHELKAGIDHQRVTENMDTGYPGGMWFQDENGVPVEVYILDAIRVKPRQQRTAIYAQDRWQVSSRITLEPGVRVAFNRGGVESQGTVFSTNPVSPRFGVAWDVGSGHRTVVRAHYGRYHDGLLTGHYSFMDPLGNPVSTYALVVGPNQYETVSTTGGTTDRAIDPNVTHSYVDAYVVGMEHELFANFSVRTQYLRRNYENFLSFVDPVSIYAPVSRPDPGPDGRLGTADDAGSITVFDRQNAGGSYRLLTNIDEAYRRYHAVQVIGTKRYSQDWELQASYTWSRARGNVNNLVGTNSAGNGLGPNGIFANPNRLINQEGAPPHDYPHQVTLLGTVRLPYWSGFNVGAVYRYYSGRASGRTIRVTGLRQGPETIWAEPVGAYRMPATNQLDLRAEKTWQFNETRLGIVADALNVNNQGTSRFLNAASGPNFGLPVLWSTPRSLRVGARVMF